MNVTQSALHALLLKLLPAQVTVGVEGSPGGGKTQVITAATEECGMDIIYDHPSVSDPTDYKGLPMADKAGARFAPIGLIKRLLEIKKPTVVFVDDLGQAMHGTQAALMQRLVAAFDSSGSTARYAEDYASELQSILDSVQPERLDVIVCDAKVRHVQSFEPGDAVVVEAKGRGGTDFRPVFDVIEDPKQAAANGLDIDDPPICLVYLTDLDGTFPRITPDYPVLWIAVDAHGKTAPFGETIHVT